jgi:hypothetical protein
MTPRRFGRWPVPVASVLLAASFVQASQACPATCFHGPTFEEADRAQVVAEAKIERIYTPGTFMAEEGIRALSRGMVPPPPEARSRPGRGRRRRAVRSPREDRPAREKNRLAAFEDVSRHARSRAHYGELPQRGPVPNRYLERQVPLLPRKYRRPMASHRHGGRPRSLRFLVVGRRRKAQAGCRRYPRWAQTGPQPVRTGGTKRSRLSIMSGRKNGSTNPHHVKLA